VARLICSAIASLDGSVADEDGRFDRAAPDEEVHAACRSSWAAGRGRSPTASAYGSSIWRSAASARARCTWATGIS
jgi:hypothetical protein